MEPWRCEAFGARYVSEGGFCGKPNPDGTRQMLLLGGLGLGP